MSVTHDNAAEEPQRIIADLRKRLDEREAECEALLAEKDALTEALVRRNDNYRERIDHQSATIDVLRVMSASPDDPQPVFDLIATRARDLCGAYGVSVHEYDGAQIYLRAVTGVSDDEDVRAAYRALYPRPATRETPSGIAILDRRVVRIDDVPNTVSPDGTVKSVVVVPVMRGAVVIGAISMGGRERGGFSDAQVELLKTFAEQAAIAISSAGTYRALQTRTADLHESLEYQTAIADVLKVIGRSTFDLEPVLDTLLATAMRLCEADNAVIFERDGATCRAMAASSFTPEATAFLKGAVLKLDHSFVSGRVLLDGGIIQVEDATGDPDYNLPATTVLALNRTVLGVPLTRDGAVIGVITLSRQRVQPFSERQIALVSTFADQAVIAIENTRLLTEQREALARQTAMAELLGVINANPGDIQPVSDAILEKAHELCGAETGALTLYEDGKARVVATHGLPDHFAARLRAGWLPVIGSTFELSRGARYTHIPDLRAVDWPEENWVNRGLVAYTNARTRVAVPLRKDGVFLGILSANRSEVRPFTEQEIALLENFAAQAVIAMENARLLGELRDRTAELAQRNTAYAERIGQQAATIDVLQAMAASPEDTRPVFQLIVDRARAFCESELAALALVVDGMLVSPVHSGFSADAAADYEAAFPRPVGPDTLLGRAVLAGDASRLPDTTADPSYAPEMVSLANHTGTRSNASVPLRRGGIVIGAITIGRRQPGMYSDAQMELLRTFADQAVIALASAETFQALRDRTDDLARSLEQRSAVAEVMAAINANPGEIAPVFDTILEKAHLLCGGVGGNLALYDGEGFHRVAYRRMSPMISTLLVERPNPGGPRHRLVMGDRYAHVADLDDPNMERSAAMTALREREGLRSFILVPMRRDGTLLGYISVNWAEPKPDVTNEVALLESFAAQAVIAIDNARLITEQREALERQMAMAEILHVISTSAGDLRPVFDVIRDRAFQLCDAQCGGIMLAGDSRFGVTALKGLPPAYLEYCLTSPDYGTGSVSRRLRAGETVHCDDMREDEGYRAGQPPTRALVELGGARSFLGVPLKSGDRVYGGITLYRREVRPFTDKQAALLREFATQAMIAVENARLINEQREALEQQTAMAEVLAAINASPGELAPVFDMILEKAHQLCGSAIGNLALYDGTQLRRVAFRGMSDATSNMAAERRRMSELQEKLARGERFAHVADLDAPDAPRTEPLIALRQREGIRSFVLVPLRREGAFVGYISANWTEPRPNVGKEVALLENFAAQAVIAMENARLLTEQREALEQQTATAEVLGVINANPGVLTPVFDAMLEKATRLCDAHSGFLWTYDGERYRAAATRGLPPAFVDFLSAPRIPGPGTGIARLAQGEAVVHYRDLLELDSYKDGDALQRASVDLGGFRTIVAVPLRKDGHLLGGFTIDRHDVRPFDDKQIALLQNFAAQAVIAMENARLLNEQREALERQTATAEILRVINASPGELQPVFDTVLKNAMRLCGAAFGELFTHDGVHWTTAAQRGLPPAYATFRQLNPPTGERHDSTSTRILRDKRTIHILDLTVEDLYKYGGPRTRASVDLGGARTILTVPLLDNATVRGCVSIYRQEVQAFSDREIALVEGFANQATIAMENARLLNEIKQRQGELDVTFESMGDGVALFDETYHLAAWNQNFQDMLDVPTDIVANRPAFADYIRYLADRGEYGPEPGDMVQRLLSQPGQRATFERTRPNGQTIQIRTNPTPTGGFVVIYTDITVRKRAEEALRATRDAAETALRELRIAQANLVQAEKMASLGQLTAGIAHEIKNPLNFVNNFAALSVELLDEFKETAAPALSLLTDDQRADIDDVSAMLTTNLRKIEEHGKRADGIVRAMLEHSRGSSGERREVDLNALVDEALNLAYHGARAQDQNFNITLERDFEPGITPIEVNPQDLTRVFLNIFSNGFYAANKRMREQGGDAPTLRVTTRGIDDAVEIRIRDNGTGIPPDIRDKLFQPFFTTKPTGEGTGLGLSITYDIVTKAHGGSIAVDSELGAYTEFLVTLPRHMFAEQGERS